VETPTTNDATPPPPPAPQSPLAARSLPTPSDATPTGPRRLTVSITPRSIWLAAGIAIGLLIVIVLITHALSALVLVFLAITLGEAIRPLVARLQRWRVPQPIAVILIYLVGLLVFAGLIALLLAPLIAQINTFVAQAPTYLTQIQGLATQIDQTLHANSTIGPIIDSIAQQLVKALQGAVPGLLNVPVTVVTEFFTLLISVVVVLTMTLLWLGTSAKLRTFLLGLFPASARPQAESVFSEMGTSLGGYVRGVLIAMLLIGILSGLGLTLIGVPYALLLGVLAGLTELIPYIGPWISGSVAILVALVAVDPLKALEVFVLFNVIQQVEGNAVQPLVMSRQVHIDPLTVIVAILIGSSLLGLMGAVLAVPLAAVLRILVARVLAPAIRDALGASAESEAPPLAAESTEG
jgi:predicted PurR-regulated permease PerM